MSEYGSHNKHVMLSAFDNAGAPTALNYNQAIGVTKSVWTMYEPFTVVRFYVEIMSAFTVTTAPVVSLFRRAKAGSGTGQDDTSSSAAFMTDSGEAFTADEFIGWTIYNITDGSSGVITDNSTTTVTATLSGGTDNDWDSGDYYIIGYELATITIPTGAVIGNVYYANVNNAANVSGTGPNINSASACNIYKERPLADIYAGEQLIVIPTTLGVGSAGTYQPGFSGHYTPKTAANMAKLIVSA